MAARLARFLAARPAGIGRVQPDRVHFRSPFLVVIAGARRLAEMVLPKVRHLMRQRRKALLVRPAFEVRRIQRDFVGDLRAVLRSEPAAREIPVGFVFALQGHEAGPQLAAEKPR